MARSWKETMVQGRGQPHLGHEHVHLLVPWQPQLLNFGVKHLEGRVKGAKPVAVGAHGTW